MISKFKKISNLKKLKNGMALPLVVILGSVFLLFGEALLKRGTRSKETQVVDMARVRAELIARGVFQLAKLKASLLHTRTVDAVKWYFGYDPYAFSDTFRVPDLRMGDNSHRNYFIGLFQNVNSSPTGINYVNVNPYPAVFSVNLLESEPVSRSRFGADVEEYSLKIVVDVETPDILNRAKLRTFKLDSIIKIRKGT